MNAFEVNRLLASGEVRQPGVLPKLDELADERFVFHTDFGLDSLPESPGVILIRGVRQYGKSTWLQARIRESVDRYGAGSSYYLNGDEIRDGQALAAEIRQLLPLFAAGSAVRRLFVDEITAVKDWRISCWKDCPERREEKPFV